MQQVLFLTTDVGGGRSPSYFRCENAIHQLGDAIVFVVDACDSDRAVEAKEELHRMIRRTKSTEDTTPPKRVLDGVPILVLATKHTKVSYDPPWAS
jgi:hypothetical protein